MARPLSLDLRERIIGAVEGGLSRRAAAERFQTSVSCVIKLVQRWKETGSAAPGTMGGHKAFALAGHEGLVRELCKAQPDITLDELHARLAAARVRVGRTSVHRFLKALGLTRKKRRSTPQNRTERTSRRRALSGARIKQA
jgi:putative transposase